MKKYFINSTLLGLILLLFLIAESQNHLIPEEAKQITSGGYSIFKETMADMPWTEIEESIKNEAIVLLPVGVIEEHGPHTCCGADAYQAYLSARIVKKELNRRDIPALIAPPLYWGIAEITNCFPGTFTVSESTMRSILADIFKSLKRWGVKKVVVFNGHGEPSHVEVLRNSIVESNIEKEFNIYFLIDDKETNKFKTTAYKNCVIPVSYQPKLIIESKFDNCHADCIETGTLAGFYPELTDTLLARSLEPTNFRDNKEFKTPADVGRAWAKDARRVTPLGYFGDPASFNASNSVINYINDSKNEAEAIELFFKKD